MKWYDVIQGEENRVPNFFMATKFDLLGHGRLAPVRGIAINEWSKMPRLWSDKPEWDGMPDDILANSLHWPIFSRRLRDALRDAGIGIHDIQYLPVHVARTTGEEISDVAVANVITRVPALDREHSFLLSVNEDKIDPSTGQPDVTGIGKPALRAELIGGHDVLRIVEYFPPIFVSERFVQVFNRHGFTGTTFRAIPTY
jgi:hypothetical protein